MNKKLLFAAILAIGMIAAFNVKAVKKESGDIRLQNIEMLSSGETGDNVNCLLIGSLDCPVNETKVRILW